MDDWRRVTGTQFLQAIWTILLLAVGAGIQLLQPVVGGLLRPTVFLSLSAVWIGGLVVIALYDRRHWNRMVEASSFKPNTGTTLADLETIKAGRSVTVETGIPDVLSQAHMTVHTPVEGVSASFTVQLRYVGSGGAEEGIQTGTDELDDSFVIRGTRENVGQLLSPEIQAMLMDIDTVGTCTITGSAVEYDIPFTRLEAAEIEQIATTVVALAERVEELANA
ncbi:hypothetical protein GRX03_06840 [Halovenus sp. WSH3]|uniref:Uncharacterized protein n=1 Tax=Halovenus carboxidivorans TaxID=2692199 RepID=A0A6B0T804_9EURY|nr:hypothetical protein [Halovenus carboxidivorans]MXR51321.1 hypothetical protein [Halovenus carboxidivorans]